MVILLIGRVINGILPFALGELTRIFEGQSTRSPWTVLGLFVALRFLQGSGGLNALRDVSQHAIKSVSSACSRNQ